MVPESSRVNPGRRTPFRPSLSMGELAHVVENLDVYRSCCDWITNYLAKPHPELGRSGSVCPFAAPAITKDSLRIAVVRLSETSERRSQIVDAVSYHRESFLSLGTADETHVLHAILILFPDVKPDETSELIDGTKEELKATFVEQGLMLGEFHARNSSPGIHNPGFRPLRSAIPMLAIRRMVASDYVFLDRSEYDTATRLRYVETYLKVARIADSNTRKKLEQTVATLKGELQEKAAGHGKPRLKALKATCPFLRA